MSTIASMKSAADYIPNGRAHTFLLLYAQIKYQLAILRVPIDLAPVAPTHDMLLLSLSAVRIFREKWKLQHRI